jgi:hypothetical protein
VILPMLRTATAAGLLSIASLAQAATPLSLPLGNIGAQLTDDVELPVPPPPRVARPDVSQFRLVVKPMPRGCEGEERRPTSRRHAALNAERSRRAPAAGDRLTVTPVRNPAAVRTPASSRLG